MPDTETARLLLSAARRDLQALEHMLDEQAFPLEIFGFHAQQALEKTLKSCLAIAGVDIPLTHNIRHLLVLLETAGFSMGDLWDLVFLTAFAVQFRYEAFDNIEDSLDRLALLTRLQTLMEQTTLKLKSI